MSLFIKPAFKLMSLLSYRGKFLLIASLFTVPLLLFSGSLALNFHQDSEQALYTQNGLSHLKEITLLIENLEDLRDSAVINFAVKSELFTEHFETAKSKILRQLKRLKNEPMLAKHLAFMELLETQIIENKIFPGNEGGGINVVFENANVMVEKVYLWRLRLSFEYVPFSQGNQDIVTILNVINQSNGYFIALGKARAYGSFYLQRKHINSHGINLIDNSYQELERLIYESSELKPDHAALMQRFPQFGGFDVGKQLEEAQLLLEDKLIQAIELDYDAAEFYQKNTKTIQSLYQYNFDLYDLVESLVAENYKDIKLYQTAFYAISTCLILTLIYLFTGFFSYLSITLTELIRSAEKVAQGDYQEEIKIQAKDELRSLASAMEDMRVDLKTREEELKKLALTDGLTKLSNRKRFDDSLPISLSNAIRSGAHISIVLMDIDHFKSINDTYGHQVGDDCLKEAAKLFKAHFQRSNDIAARYGGEEFVAVLYGQAKEEAMSHCEKLRQKIEALEIQSQGYRLSFTASFGISTLEPPHQATGDELIYLADSMLYKAKETGRNCVQHATARPAA